VLDIHLPDLLGFQVCRLLRQRPSTADLPILHVTDVFRSNADQAASAMAGADAYYETPVDMDRLVLKIDALILACQARRRLAQPHPGFASS
jgi:DNA-binding response OmpR family regulator